MAAPASLKFDTSFDPEVGRPVPVAPGVVRVTAGNVEPYTFTGTNSFIVGEATVAVIDPGPNDSRHLESLLAAIGGREVVAIILTHTHLDHSALVPRLQEATRAPVWSGGPHRLSRKRRLFEVNPVGRDSDWRLIPDRVLADGERISAGDVPLEVIATPGHCANHLGFGVVDTPWLLTGDHIMGWNSTLVSVPDGSMADYLVSLEKVIGREADYRHYIPAHGGAIPDGPDYARALLAHRQGRNGQVVEAVNAGARSVRELLQPIYPTLALPLHGAALMTLAAHVEYLAERGAISAQFGLFGTRLSPAKD